MDWRGIEWIIPAYEVSMLLVPVPAFVIFRRRCKDRVLTKVRALACYAGAVISPVVIYTVLLFVLVGADEVAGTAMITEGLARSAPVLIGLGLAVWLVATAVFGAMLLFPAVSGSPDGEHPSPAGKRRD